jgi:hypothetical protein
MIEFDEEDALPTTSLYLTLDKVQGGVVYR